MVVLGLVGNSAHSQQTLYGITFPGTLITIDTTTGKGTIVDPATAAGIAIEAMGIAFHPNGKLYTFDRLTVSFFELSTTNGQKVGGPKLATFPPPGAPVLVPGSIAFDQAGLGYFMNGEGGFSGISGMPKESVYTFDVTLASPAMTQLSVTGQGEPRALAVDSFGGLFCYNSLNDLYSVNKATGAKTLFVDYSGPGFPFTKYAGLAYTGGKIFVAESTASAPVSQLYELTLAGTRIATAQTTGFGNVSGLAFSTFPAVVSLRSGTLDEAVVATTATYTVALQSSPTVGSTVTINLTTPDGQTIVAPATLTFDDTNWMTAQTVTVTVVDDALPEATPHIGSIIHTAASVDPKFVGTFSAAVNIMDNDSGAGITVLTSVPVTEGSSTAYTMSLQKLPTAPVTITITPDPQLTFVPATLTFTVANWSVPQTITVTAVDDVLVQGNRTLPIAHIATSADPAYGITRIVNITITDNETPLPGPGPAPKPGSGTEGSFVGIQPSPVAPGGGLMGGEGGFGRSVKRQADAPQGTLLGPYAMHESGRTQVRAGNVLPAATKMMVFNSAHSRATPQSAGMGLAGIVVLTGLGIGLGLPLAYGAYKHLAC